MAIMINRVASGLLALAYILGAALTGGIATALTIGVFLLLPLACIWFPDEMGSLAYVRSMPMNETPAFLVIGAGWLLLLLPILITIYRASQGG